MKVVYNDIKELNQTLGGSITGLSSERIAHLNDNVIQGMAFESELVSGISYRLYDLKVEETTLLKCPIKNDFGLFFIYPLQGDIECLWSAKKEELQKVDEYCPAIFGGYKSKEGLNIKISAGQNIKFILIQIDDEISNMNENVDSTSASLVDQLYSEFFTNHNQNEISYLGSCNLRIKEQFEELKKVRSKGLTRKLLVEGIIHFALALLVKHYQEDVSKNQFINPYLTKRELVRINSLVNKIRHKPEYPYNLDELCSEVGLTAAKVQDGFKELTGTTVNCFIRDNRLETAETMMKEGEYNISQIVYAIGLSSRSYFSKIFKNKYGCSPRNYLHSIKHKSISA